ncbi:MULTISPECIES: SDR family oxidoreductase [Pandoraea]|uniref:Short-chain dehydrogenase/reductase SDR n=1 Tax=Pandoraea communis TaxID=2508297 RepID=A0A5E4RAT5_9BURK|nr:MULTISPECIES: SDR family oxidoreductase [Pandoraea]EON13801.1 short-chain dehydrogenase/reductase SDR [Pandoraea sp. SD6-2]VVD59614.1 short-chain dehydrogenase/reductase SDR [Pandoraea communis]
MELGIIGKRALVLGGNRGIGLGIARALVAEGASVVVTGRDATRLGEAVDELRAIAFDRGGNSQQRVEGRTVDLTRVSTLPAFAAEIVETFGDIDILVNNTGGPGYGGASGRSASDWNDSFQEMVLSVITVTDALLPAMRKRGWGRVMTVVSSGVVQPIPILGISNALRNALVTWSKTLSQEVAREGVTVNVLVPGRIDTERVRLTDAAVADKERITAEEARARSTATIPMGRYGTTAEFGALAAFVASEPASYITGSLMRCDGGNIRSV